MDTVQSQSGWLSNIISARSALSQRPSLSVDLRKMRAQRFVCVASITNFKERARVSRLKRIMIITLGQGTLTSWKWMGSSLWELWQEGSSCLSEGRRGSKICLACGHPVCSCVLIRRNQSRINDQNISGQCYTDNKVWFCMQKPQYSIYKQWQTKRQTKHEYNKRIKFKISTETMKLSSHSLCCSQCGCSVQLLPKNCVFLTFN